MAAFYMEIDDECWLDGWKAKDIEQYQQAQIYRQVALELIDEAIRRA